MVTGTSWRQRVISILLSVAVVGAVHLIRGTTSPLAAVVIGGSCAVVFVTYEYVVWRRDLSKKS